MPWMANPAFQGGDPITPVNPPATKNILTAAILAGSFFFMFTGDYAIPDREIEYVNKWQIQNIDIVPVAKATLSQAIRASILEQTLPGVDASVGVVERGKDQWDEQVPPKGLDKWKPTFPDIVPAKFHKELSPAIQAGSVFHVNFSQAAGNWNANPFKANLYPGDFAGRHLDYFYPKKELPAAIQAGHFFHVNFINMAAKDWLPNTRNMMWLVEVPDWQLRDKTGLPQAIQAGSFFHVNFGDKTAKTWNPSVQAMAAIPETPDNIPSYTIKRGLSEAIQAGSFTQPPYMSLAINYKSSFVMEEFFPDVQMHRIFEIKKILPASIQAGSFFEVPPTVYPAKTWATDLKTMGWQPELPDITYNMSKAGLSTAIQASSFFSVPFADGTSRWVGVNFSEWQPVYEDILLSNPVMTAAVRSTIEPSDLLPGSDVAWPSPGTGGTGIAIRSRLINVSTGEMEMIVSNKLMVTLSR